MKKKKSLYLTLLLSGCLALAGCANQSPATSADQSGTQTPAEEKVQAPASGPITINMDIPDKEVLDKGPNGEQAISAKTLQLTEAEVQNIKEGNFTAALVMHYTGTDYMTAQIDAMKATFERMGIKVIAVTDAQFKSEKQISDIETVLAKSPDIIVAVPVDPVSSAAGFQKAAKAGVKIVFMDGVAHGLEAGKDYVSIVSGDNAGNGATAAEIMAEKLGGKGKVGVIFYDADFFVTSNRSNAFEQTMKDKYPDIEIVARGGITGPNDGEKVASAMLTRYPDLDGLFVIWDVPAEGAIAAARTAGKNDLVITTTDLGTNVGIEVISGGIAKGIGAQLPYDQGVAQAILAGYGILGKEAPAYVSTPSLPVTQENLLDAWKLVYGVDAPDIIKNAAK
ncbi:substrate-binding domain-containing protein [Ammoniphilus sp. YIM 78166]|uniref:substrate-binding domain-containing protein n=1 Tax=Ammoniphilus sp. YIM 78166 TaxID=1644106 RepID=UPI00107052A3|nr:substrate-binding domain-containing protein [Ammoniphilus sp. YIM 78166]